MENLFCSHLFIFQILKNFHRFLSSESIILIFSCLSLFCFQQKEVRELKTANSDSRTEIDSLLKVIKKQTEEAERESSRMTQENMNLVNKIKAMEAEIKTFKGL